MFNQEMITSYGIALVKKTVEKTNNNYEILFIKKRLSYAYITFIKGIYNRNNDNDILRLLNNMTVDEKFCIMSLNFNIMWYKSMLSLPYNNKYSSKDISKFEKCKNRFEKSFLYDDGKRLLSLIKKSKSTKKIWEIPKGMTNKNESPINAAIREFYEETNIKKNKYKLLYDINPITHIFSDDNITYKYVYYIALLLDNKYTLQLDLKPDSHIMEISEMQFFNTFNYYILTKNKKMITVMKNIIKIAKNYF
jgi:8-oxo-dGTP pyrophosphatase MutT (NUDIX family)